MTALTSEMVLSRSKATDIGGVTKISVWGKNIADVSIISRMGSLESVAFPSNSIATLEPFSHCPNLKELLLRNNKIAKLSELHHLKNLTQLHTLWLDGNAIEEEPNYRLFTIALLPQLKKVDTSDVTQTERADAKRLFPSPDQMFREDPIPKPSPSPPPQKQTRSSKPTPIPQSGEPTQMDLCLIKSIQDLLPLLGELARAELFHIIQAAR